MSPGVAVGDRAGEHLWMERGRYSAWPHVVCGFFVAVLIVSLTVGLIPALIGGGIADQLMNVTEDNVRWVLIPCWFGPSAILTLLAFHDRWRCIEAFASRYASGALALSLAYVPLVAAAYGLKRGWQKLARKKGRDARR
jgi:hypothetical protein